METNEFKDRVVLVTGASRGIGRATAVAFAKRGASLVVNFSRGAEAAEETAKLCKEAGSPKVMTLQFNVSESGSVDKAIDSIKEQFGRLDVLVNNAGISRDGLVLRMKDEDWTETLDTNLKGSFFCARAASKIMLKARYGRIINISSVVGETGNAGQVPYVSSKAGLLGMTKALARELASRNVTVNAITPGFIETDMTDALDAKVKEHHLAGVPLARFGKAEEVAESVVFLASESAGYITGQVLGVNGGMYM